MAVMEAAASTISRSGVRPPLQLTADAQVTDPQWCRYLEMGTARQHGSRCW